MDALSVIAPLIGVLLGSALSGFGAYLKERRERKRTLAIALADLLEIRHRLIAVDLVLSKVREHVAVPPETISASRNLFDSFFSTNDGLDERYNEAVSLIAGIDPILAFSLRTKNSFPRLLTQFRNAAIGTGANMKDFEIVEGMLRLVAAPNLDAAAIAVARQHSWRTKRRVLKLIGESKETPPEITQFLNLVKALPSSPPTPTGPTNG